jgi:hypothetical protein
VDEGVEVNVGTGVRVDVEDGINVAVGVLEGI